MGCRNSKDATLVYRVSSVATPMRPSTPSYHAHSSKLWTSTSGSRFNELREELPSFVVSDSAHLVGSSDGEPVHGLTSAFNFSFIQASEASSTRSSRGYSSFMSEDQTLPGPPESLTFAMTDDPVELTPIPEERRARINSVRASTRQDSPVPTQSESEATEPDEEKSTSSLANEYGENSAVSESAVTVSSELLVYELVASNISLDSSNSTMDSRHSMDAAHLCENSEYVVTETKAIVRHEALIKLVPKVLSDESEVIAAAFVQEIIDAVVLKMTKASIDGDRLQPRDRGSLQVEPSSTGRYCMNIKKQQSKDASLLSSHTPIYAIVDTSTVDGVVMYHVQLMDDATESTKWPTSLLCRYSSFREMYSKLKETKLPAADKLPMLPGASIMHFMRGRQNKRTIEERQEQFTNVLRYIAEHRELHDSDVFQTFLAQ